MAQNCVECGVLKREPPAISRYAYKVRSLDRSRVTAGRYETFLVQVYTDDLTSRDRFGQAHRDSRVTTSAIEHDHVRPQMREQKVCVDIRAASGNR
jgi:hypothetical protein